MIDLHLNQTEWAEVSRAFDESTRKAPVAPPRPGTLWSMLSHAMAMIIGEKPVQEPDTPRRQALRQFVHASIVRRGMAEEYVPALLSFGLNRRQVEALAMLTVPGQLGQEYRAH
ncbi:hypothetical protein [Sphingobium sp.]|uniref:hypothetical protein n=1 Tax=Sphingobium sp. TaxID=1912891 RepID=UPI003B3B3E3D